MSDCMMVEIRRWMDGGEIDRTKSMLMQKEGQFTTVKVKVS